MTNVILLHNLDTMWGLLTHSTFGLFLGQYVLATTGNNQKKTT